MTQVVAKRFHQVGTRRRSARLFKCRRDFRKCAKNEIFLMPLKATGDANLPLDFALGNHIMYNLFEDPGSRTRQLVGLAIPCQRCKKYRY